MVILSVDSTMDGLVAWPYELQAHYENIKEERVTLDDGAQLGFGEFFSAAPLFPCGGGAWLSVADLLDPTVELHVTFFPARLPPP